MNGLLSDHYKTDARFFCHWRNHWAIACEDFFLIYRQISVFAWPFTEFEWPLCEIYLVQVDDKAADTLSVCDLFHKSFAVLIEGFTRFDRHDLFVPHFLALDAMLQIKSPERCYSYALVLENLGKSCASFFHCPASPLLEGFWAEKEVKVVLVKLSAEHLFCYTLRWHEPFPAYVLNFVLSKVQTLCNSLIWFVLVCSCRGLLGSESY